MLIRFQSIFQIILLIIRLLPWSYCLKTFTNETFSYLTETGETLHFTYHYDKEALNERIADYPIHPMILSRRSLYELSGEPISDQVLFSLFEAMRWGSSAFNSQPWRIVYAHQGTTRFNEFLNLMVDKNQAWCKHSSVIMIIIADMVSMYQGEKFFLSSQPTGVGAAISGMALEATSRGLVFHTLGGFDRNRAAKALGIDRDPHFQVVVMAVIGKRVAPTSRGLSGFHDRMTQRNHITQFISKDNFNFK